MRKTIAALVALLVLATSSAGFAAERCRVAGGAGAGRFARCGSPGAIPASQYVRKCTREGRVCRVSHKRGARGSARLAPTQSVIRVVEG